MTATSTLFDEWRSDPKWFGRRWRGKFVWLNASQFTFDEAVRSAESAGTTVAAFSLRDARCFADFHDMMRRQWPSESWMQAKGLDAFQEALGIVVESAPGASLCIALDAADMPAWPDYDLLHLVEILCGEVADGDESSRQKLMGQFTEMDVSSPGELTVLWRGAPGSLPSPFRNAESGLMLTSMSAPGNARAERRSIRDTRSMRRASDPLPEGWIHFRAESWRRRFVWLNSDITPIAPIERGLRAAFADELLWVRSSAGTTEEFARELRQAHHAFDAVGDSAQNIAAAVGSTTLAVVVDAREMTDWPDRAELIALLQDAVSASLVHAPSQRYPTLIWLDSASRMPCPFDKTRAAAMLKTFPSDRASTRPY